MDFDHIVTYIEKFLKLANFYGSSYYFLNTLFMYHTYRIQTKNATESIFQIKAFYLKELHFNCTFSLDPVSIIYNHRQGFEEMI
jgi:hypothetical protein